MEQLDKFVFVCVMLESRRIYYYTESTGTLWTPDIQQAKIFYNQGSLSPIRAARSIAQDCEYKYVRLNPALFTSYSK